MDGPRIAVRGDEWGAKPATVQLKPGDSGGTNRALAAAEPRYGKKTSVTSRKIGANMPTDQTM